MMNRDPVIFLPGGGSDEQEPVALRAIVEAGDRFRMVSFPGWRRYVSKEFSPEGVMSDIAAFIEARAPLGPIWVAGMSLGAHFGYSAAVRLQKKGRKVAGFCAIDGLMNGYPGRQAIQLVRERQFRAVWDLAKAKAQHSAIRLRGSRSSGTDAEPVGLAALVLWLSAARAWTLSLDIDPIPLDASNALVRTRPGAADDKVWKRRCPGARIFTVPGAHHTMLDPQNVEAFGRAMAAAMHAWQ